MHRRIVSASEITVEIVQVGIRGFTDSSSPAARVQHARRRDRHFRRGAPSVRRQKPEVLNHRVAVEADLAHHAHTPRFRRDSFEGNPARRSERLAALKLLEKVKMPYRASKLAIRRAGQAD